MWQNTGCEKGMCLAVRGLVVLVVVVNVKDVNGQLQLQLWALCCGCETVAARRQEI